MTLTRRTALQLMTAGPMAAQRRAPARKPNFIVIMADDLGYGDIACFGGKNVATPNIDSLAVTGTRFTDGYVSCAVCSPSRAALLTGRYQQRFGHEFNPTGDKQDEFGLPKTETILPQYLRPLGYRTGAVGKWHLGFKDGYLPQDRGFDEYFGFLGGANDYVTSGMKDARGLEDEDVPQQRRYPILRGKQEIPEMRHLTDAFAEEACSFIERNRTQPFFLYLPLNSVHGPFQTIERYWNRAAGVASPPRRMLAAMAAAMDDAVGAVLGRLREYDLEKDTAIFFLSDNGSPLSKGTGSNGILNGSKFTYYEGGVRVPFLAKWPGKIPAGKVYRHSIVSRDIVPTLLAAAGAPQPPGVSFDGVDLMPFLNGSKTYAPHDVLCWRAGIGRAVVMGRWKLVECGPEHIKLYDLSADPGETNDVSAKFPAVLQELRQAWSKWNSQMAAPRWPPRKHKSVINGEPLTWEI